VRRKRKNPLPGRFAVLLTCHNRKETTLAALRRLFEQRLPKHGELTVFLVDDGSSDGTSEAIRKEFQQIRLLRGNGNLYWGGGMRCAFGEALKEDYDYYFWLNDDTYLDSDALARMVAAHEDLIAQNYDCSIMVGSLRDPASGTLTYGGVVHRSRIHPLKYALLPPGSEPLSCDTMNGNAVLIPRSVANLVGNISSSFTHNMGDLDYGLRARKLGCSVWIAPGFVGTCSWNKVKDTYLDPVLPLSERLNKMFTTKGLPAREYYRYARAHAGVFWPFFGGLPYIRITLHSLLCAIRPKRGSSESLR